MVSDSSYGQVLQFPQQVTFGRPALTDVLCNAAADAGAIGVVLAELGLHGCSVELRVRLRLLHVCLPCRAAPARAAHCSGQR